MHGWFRQQGVVVRLLGVAMAIASLCPSAGAQDQAALPSSPSQSQSGVAPGSADFDGDRIIDPLTLARTGWQPSIAVTLSRTRDVSIVVVESSHAGTSSLAVRDLDADGDTDMVWKAAVPLAPLEIIIWLNDGAGHFTHVLPLRAPPFPPTPRRALRADAAGGPPALVVLPKQNSSPVSLLVSAWVLPVAVSVRPEHASYLPSASFLQRRPVDRGPPLLS